MVEIVMMERFRPEELKVVRLMRGLNLREAEEATGVTKESISELERGLRFPQPHTLRKLANGYGVPVEHFLVTREEAMLPKAQAPPEVTAEDRRVIEQALDFVSRWQPVISTLGEEGYEEYRQHADAWVPFFAWSWERQIEAKRKELGREPRPDELSMYKAFEVVDDVLHAGRVRAVELATEEPDVPELPRVA